MNIMITGSGGQLGSEFRAMASAYPQWNFFCFSHQDLDISEESAVIEAMRQCRCDIVLNCAAFTSVDKAESYQDLSFRINRDGAGVLARSAKQQGALLIQFSTFGVFDGLSSRPYREDDLAAPKSFYGKAKLAGENLVRSTAPSYLIIRTGWLYSPFGENFVRKILRMGQKRATLGVVSDRVGSPVYAADLVAAVMDMLARIDLQQTYSATYHYANEGVCSWYDFAVAVMKQANMPCRIFPIESTEFPVSGPRPWYSVLNNNAIKRDWGMTIPYWKDSLGRAVLRMPERTARHRRRTVLHNERKPGAARLPIE